jgi:hypothetical protein
MTHYLLWLALGAGPISVRLVLVPGWTSGFHKESTKEHQVKKY